MALETARAEETRIAADRRRAEEAERIAAWLELPGVRLIETDGEWAWPLHAGLPDGALADELLGPAPPLPLEEDPAEKRVVALLAS